MGGRLRDHGCAALTFHSTNTPEVSPMRLTLRTLLAWLDDTLQPTQVREIGSQVAESPFAQELTERIHRVTRQRRLSVPNSSGPDGTDPNVVASYLDNDLDPEPVAEYEKQCLTSDVKLAEVASVHQILSLLGQKVRVPAEAKSRMYQLVKGRETVRERSPSNRKPQSPEPVTRPIQPWVDPDPIRRSWIERFGLVAAGLGLIMLSIFTASWSLRVPPSEPLIITPGSKGEAVAEVVVSATGKDELHASMPAAPEEVDGAPADPARAIGTEKSASAGVGVGDVAHAPKSKEAVEAKASKTGDSASGASGPASVKLPAGSSGLAATDGGVLLRYNVDQREWERLTGTAPVSRSDRLLCLSPFRATVTLGTFALVMVGETEIRILSHSSDKIPAVELIQGRLLVRNPPAGTLKVGFSDRSVTEEFAPSSSVVMERTGRREYGRTISQAPPLFIYCTQGEVALTVGQKQESLTASDVVVIDTAGTLKRTGIDTPPAWTTETGPSPHEIQLRDRFIRMFHPGRPVLTEIVAASEDENSDVRELSILALKSLGDLSLLMPTLSRAGDAVTRKGALAAIRSYMGLGPDAANRVRDQLAEEFGDDTAAFVAKMLVGYTPDEASDPKVFERLVAALGPEQQSLGVRELALDSLKQLTGRDDLSYDPDHPDGKGLSTWKELQRQGKLRYSASRGKAK
jgi:hypothetical protein